VGARDRSDRLLSERLHAGIGGDTIGGMSGTLQVLRAAQANPSGVSFADLQRLVEGAGFILARQDGSHYVYRKQGVTEIITLQKNGDLAKTYQVRQVILVLEKVQGDEK
jgi:predicted RNA binding protein YcfA (HicA-like mRNA interferase family)